jgi:serine/threonine protein kinase
MLNDPLPVRIGEVVAGKYRVERVLGRGGMGAVVAARHVELDGMVALKFLLPKALGGRNAAERFMREARATVRLTNEHSVRVYDVGKLPDLRTFIVMELLQGRDLAQVIEGGRLPVPLAVDYILQACEAVAEAHGQGIIHRDLKLSNLFLATCGDGTSLVKVIDFGLAKPLAGQPDTDLTKTKEVLGSPEYMSPEQMRAFRDVDTRTDIWSLGVCLYELLTKRTPFFSTNVAELCAKVLTQPATPPGERRSDIPARLSEAVMRCLEKEPGDRFGTVGALALALQPFSSPAESSAAERVNRLLSAPTQGVIAAPVRAASPFGDTQTDAAYDSGPSGTNRPLQRFLVAFTLSAAVAGLAFGAYHLSRTAPPKAPPPAIANDPPPPPKEPPSPGEATVDKAAPTPAAPPTGAATTAGATAPIGVSDTVAKPSRAHPPRPPRALPPRPPENAASKGDASLAPEERP